MASETCALDLVRADYIREIEPGEMVVISDDGVRSLRPFPSAPPKRCIFEYVILPPDSLALRLAASTQVRKMQGRALAPPMPGRRRYRRAGARLGQRRRARIR